MVFFGTGGKTRPWPRQGFAADRTSAAVHAWVCLKMTSNHLEDIWLALPVPRLPAEFHQRDPKSGNKCLVPTATTSWSFAARYDL